MKSWVFILMFANLTAAVPSFSSSSDLRHDVMTWNFQVSGASAFGMSIAVCSNKSAKKTSQVWPKEPPLTTYPCPNSIRVKRHRIDRMGASDIQGLLCCWIGHDCSGRHVWHRRGRCLLGSQQELSDPRARSVRAGYTAARGFGTVGESCRYGVIPWMYVNQALITLRNFIISHSSSTARTRVWVNHVDTMLRKRFEEPATHLVPRHSVHFRSRGGLEDLSGNSVEAGWLAGIVIRGDVERIRLTFLDSGKQLWRQQFLQQRQSPMDSFFSALKELQLRRRSGIIICAPMLQSPDL